MIRDKHWERGATYCAVISESLKPNAFITALRISVLRDEHFHKQTAWQVSLWSSPLAIEDIGGPFLWSLWSSRMSTWWIHLCRWTFAKSNLPPAYSDTYSADKRFIWKLRTDNAPHNVRLRIIRWTQLLRSCHPLVMSE
jgi:hypothetical protein